nr:hypothetical protein [Anaerofilum sp. An201]
MKKIVNGIWYDTGAARMLSTYYFFLDKIPMEESAYQMPDGACFIVRRINGSETALLPIAAEDIPRWKKYRSQFITQLWLG